MAQKLRHRKVCASRLLQMRSAGITLWDALRQAPALPEAQQASRLSFAIDLVSELNQQAGRMRAADLLNQFLDTTYYRAILRRAGQTRALRNVAKLLDDVHRSDLVNVMDFLTYAQTLRESGAREGEARATAGGAVQIMTIHAAKGLEFPVVVLGDANSGRYHAQNMVVDEALGVLLSTKNDDDVRAASYQLWQILDKAQSQAETDRMLYVALTRAEQLVLVNGHASLKKSGQASFNGWLGQLAEVTGLAKVDLSGYDESGGRAHSFDLSLKRTNVQAMIYEPHCIPRAGPPTDQSQEEPAFDLANMKLRQALQTTGSGSVTGPELQPQVWGTRSKKNRRRAPGHVIGTLVHEALATWRFPQAGFEAWVASRARHLGVCDQQCLSDAQRRTRHLLERFREHPFCLEIENADKRLHELPYIYDRDGVLENGKIDLLFRRGKHWTLVDFKTDYLRDEAAYQRTLAEQQYSEQLGRYRQAVESLLHVEPRLILCLLDFMGDVRLVVDPDQSTQPQAPAD